MFKGLLQIHKDFGFYSPETFTSLEIICLVEAYAYAFARDTAPSPVSLLFLHGLHI